MRGCSHGWFPATLGGEIVALVTRHMIDPKNVEQVLNDLRQALPGGFAQDMEKNLRAALTATLARLNLVTREELEVQAAVLTRTREKIAALEKQVAELETLLRK